MKPSVSVFSLLHLLAVPYVAAFPSRLLDVRLGQEQIEVLARALMSTATDFRNADSLSRRAAGFNATQQLVSIDGQHAFIAPNFTAGDVRGPCPGLNAMANHNYIPHNGVATIQQFIDGTYAAFGMGVDLATFLAVYGAVMNGDGKSWSIGGPAALNGDSTSLQLLGTPQGITGSHNNYESDVSPTRGDLYEYGNNYLVQLSQFKQLYALPLGPAGYDLSVLTPFRATRFNQSIANNPYFFNAPFSGVIVQPAAYTFIYRFMGNKSTAYPEGYLDAATLKSFFSITGSSPANFVYTPGHEAFPRNWYKRAIGDEYTIPFFGGDAIAAGLQYPQFASVGGNTGTTNSFTGIDVTAFSSGVYNAKTLLQGNNLLCFGLQAAQSLSPDILAGLVVDVAQATGILAPALNEFVTAMGCPAAQSVNDKLFAPYPGAKGSG